MPKQKNPSEMTDKELEKAIDEPEEQEEELEEEAEVQEEQEEEEPEEQEGEDEEDEQEERKPSRRESLRIQQLLGKLKETKPAAKPAEAPDAMDYDKTLTGDPELIKKLKEDRDKTNAAFYNQGLEQVKSIQFHTRLEIDAPRVATKYPQLDKESDDFNPELAQAINTMFLSTVGYDSNNDTVRDPALRYSDYVGSVFELANEIAGVKTSTTTKNIKRQAAKTGIRPGGGVSKKMNLDKPAAQMTDEELDAVIAMAVPSA